MQGDAVRVCDLRTETIVSKINEGRNYVLDRLPKDGPINMEALLRNYSKAFKSFFQTSRPEKVEKIKPKPGKAHHHHHPKKYRTIENYKKPADIESGQCTLMQRTIFTASVVIQWAKMLQECDQDDSHLHDQERIIARLKSDHGQYLTDLKKGKYGDPLVVTETEIDEFKKRHAEMPTHQSFYVRVEKGEIPRALRAQILATMQMNEASSEMIDIVLAFVASSPDPKQEFKYTPKARVCGQEQQTDWQPALEQQQHQRPEGTNHPQLPQKKIRAASACIFV